MLIRQQDMSYDFLLKIIHTNRFPRGYVEVDFADGIKKMPIQQVMLHLPAWEIYRRCKIPVTTKFIHHGPNCVSKGSFNKMMSLVYADLFYLLTSREEIELLKQYLWIALNNYDDFGSNELNEFHCSISLPDLARFVEQPEVKAIVNLDLDETKGTRYMEKQLAEATEKLTEISNKKGKLKDNILLEYQQTEIVNRNQLPQALISFGLRTEINDMVIRKPVKGSSLTGMRDICELGIEQQSARKTVYYAHQAIQTSQYWGRKQQLLGCSIEHLYPDFCGTTNCIEYTITSANSKNCIGKNINVDGKIVTLLPSNIENFIDTTVHMYSPLTCKHTDGVCSVCYGLTYKNLPVGINLGIDAASQTVSDVSQMILSTKHFIKTKSKVYEIPSPANKFIERGINGIYFKKDLYKDSDWSVGFYFKDIRDRSLTDLNLIEDDLPIPEERYSEITVMYIQDPKGNIIPLELSANGQCPYFTLQFLLYAKSQYSSIRSEESVFWIPMNKCKRVPIFRTTIANDSMMGFVMQVTKFLENGALTKYNDAGAALEEFSSLIYDKVSVNIVKLEILLKAHLVSGVGNFSIPVVNNPHKVMFDKTVNIAQNRTLSSMLALQGLKKQLASPYIYTQIRDSGPFDIFFGIM